MYALLTPTQQLPAPQNFFLVFASPQCAFHKERHCRQCLKYRACITLTPGLWLQLNAPKWPCALRILLTLKMGSAKSIGGVLNIVYITRFKLRKSRYKDGIVVADIDWQTQRHARHKCFIAVAHAQLHINSGLQECSASAEQRTANKTTSNQHLVTIAS